MVFDVEKINLKRAFSHFLSLIYPPHCPICKERSHLPDSLCEDCWKKITFMSSASCIICGLNLEFVHQTYDICGGCVTQKPYFDSLKYVCIYNEHSKKIIHSFKYGDKLHMVRLIGNLMIRKLREFPDEIHYIIPIAIHRKKLKKRMYNQSSLITNYIVSQNKSSNAVALHNLIIKHKETPSQTTLNSSQREKNVKNSFSLNQDLVNLIAGKNIIIIDDTITTGATINEVTKLIRLKSKAQKIFVLSFGRNE